MSISALFSPSKPDPSFLHEGKKLGFAEAFFETIKKYPSFLEKCSQSKLERFKGLVLQSGLKGDHELILKINDQIKKIFKPFLVKPEEGRAFRRHFPPLQIPFVMPDNRTLDDPHLNLKGVESFIDSYGDILEELTLHEVTDDLLFKIKEKCQSLKRLKIEVRIDRPVMLTNAGLLQISEIALNELDLDLDRSAFISGEGIEKLVASQNFKKSLKLLRLKCPCRIQEETLKELSSYSALESLTLSKVFTKQLLTFFNSPSLSKNLKKLDLTFGVNYLLKEKEAEAFAKFTHLTLLRLDCAWSVTDVTLAKLFDSLSKLTKINLKHVNRVIIAHLSLHLESVAFHDCSHLATDDFDLITEKRRCITEITLKKCGNFTDLNITNWLPLQLVLVHIEGSSLYKGLDGLLLQTRETLRSLTLINNPLIPTDGYRFIGQVSRLHTLMIAQSHRFTNSSLEGVLTERVRHQLKALSLSEVPISDGALLIRLPQLAALEISNCHALAKNVYQILQSVSLQIKLKMLMMDGFSLNKDLISNFDVLDVFYAGNSHLKDGDVFKKRDVIVHLFEG